MKIRQILLFSKSFQYHHLRFQSKNPCYPSKANTFLRFCPPFFSVLKKLDSAEYTPE